MTSQINIDEQQVIQLEEQSHEAFLRRDSAALDRILADAFVFTDPEGRLWTKADWIADLTSGGLIYQSIHVDDLQVRVHGDAAVTLGRVTMTTRSGDTVVTEQFFYTAMYARLDERWQAIAEQAGRGARR